MMKGLRQAVILGIFFAISSLISRAYAASVISPASQQALVYCTGGEDFSFNPQKADVSADINVVTEQLYDKLLTLDPKTHQLTPALAERFEVSEDGLTVTFHLRKKVAFHDTNWFTPTRAFNAEDVLFSLNRVLGKESDELSVSDESHTQSELAKRFGERIHFPFFESIDLKSNIAEIASPSPYIVQIRLHRPDASFLAYLASRFAVILSKEYALQLNAAGNLAQLDLLPVGTGGYQLESYVQNEYARLTLHPHYWGKAATISPLIVDFSTTATGRMAKFLNGECDIVAFPEPSQVSLFNHTRGYLVERQGANLAYLAFNFERPIGEDVERRRRIVQAIERERLANVLFYGTAEVAENVLPKTLYENPNPNGYRYQAPEQSIAGQGEPLVLWVLDEMKIYHPHPLKMAEYLRAALKRAGMDVTVRSVSRGYLTQQLEQGSADYDLILSGWLANNSDADSFLSPMLECQARHSVTNLANWCDLHFDTLLAKARLSSDEAQRFALYTQAQRYLEAQLPLLPLVNVNRLLLVNHKVSGAEISPFGQVNFAEMGLK